MSVLIKQLKEIKDAYYKKQADQKRLQLLYDELVWAIILMAVSAVTIIFLLVLMIIILAVAYV